MERTPSLSYRVLNMLTPREVVAAAGVCRAWRRAAASDTLWKPLLRRHPTFALAMGWLSPQDQDDAVRAVGHEAPAAPTAARARARAAKAVWGEWTDKASVRDVETDDNAPPEFPYADLDYAKRRQARKAAGPTRRRYGDCGMDPFAWPSAPPDRAHDGEGGGASDGAASYAAGPSTAVRGLAGDGGELYAWFVGRACSFSRGFVEDARKLRRPTEVQVDTFIAAVQDDHSWYKHLDPVQPSTFVLMHDPACNCAASTLPSRHHVLKANDDPSAFGSQYLGNWTRAKKLQGTGFLQYRVEQPGTRVTLSTRRVRGQHDLQRVPAHVDELGAVQLTGLIHHSTSSSRVIACLRPDLVGSTSTRVPRAVVHPSACSTMTLHVWARMRHAMERCLLLGLHHCLGVPEGTTVTSEMVYGAVFPGLSFAQVQTLTRFVFSQTKNMDGARHFALSRVGCPNGCESTRTLCRCLKRAERYASGLSDGNYCQSFVLVGDREDGGDVPPEPRHGATQATIAEICAGVEKVCEASAALGSRIAATMTMDELRSHGEGVYRVQRSRLRCRLLTPDREGSGTARSGGVGASSRRSGSDGSAELSLCTTAVSESFSHRHRWVARSDAEHYPWNMRSAKTPVEQFVVDMTSLGVVYYRDDYDGALNDARTARRDAGASAAPADSPWPTDKVVAEFDVFERWRPVLELAGGREAAFVHTLFGFQATVGVVRGLLKLQMVGAIEAVLDALQVGADYHGGPIDSLAGADGDGGGGGAAAGGGAEAGSGGGAAASAGAARKV